MKINHRLGEGEGGKQLKEFWKDRPQRLKEEKVLQMPLGAYSLPVFVDRKEEKEKSEREETREINGATKLLIFNQIISNNLGIIDSTKLFLTNPGLSPSGQGLCIPLKSC